MKDKPFAIRLGFALSGLRTRRRVAGPRRRTERGFRVHVRCAALVAASLPLLRPAPIRWTPAGLAVAQVPAFELIHSAMERLIDHPHPGIHPEIKLVKDMAAGGMLVIGLAALAVAAALAATPQ